MANYFVDTDLASGGADDGSSFDDAWTDIKTALEYNSFSAGDIIWIRRRSSFGSPTSDIQPDSASDGARNNPIKCVGWPRNEATGTADVIQGLRAFVDVSITPDREKHQARYIMNDADGKNYLITAIGYWVTYDDEQSAGFDVGDTVTTDGGFSGTVLSVIEESSGSDGHLVFRPGYTGSIADNDVLKVDGNDHGDASANGETCFIIDRPYAGTAESDGDFTIAKDEDYDTAQLIDDSTWTIKKTDWNGDDDDLPSLDFGAAAYQLYLYASDYWSIRNLEFKNGDDGYGTVCLTNCTFVEVLGCVFSQNQSDPCIYVRYGNTVAIRRCTFEGSGSGESQRGITYTGSACGTIEDVAVYNMGDHGIYSLEGFMKNVNSGVEGDNGDYDFRPVNYVEWFDCQFGLITHNISSSQYFVGRGPSVHRGENFQKILGSNIQLKGSLGYSHEITNKAVVIGSGDPYKRSGGADEIIKIDLYNSNSLVFAEQDHSPMVFEHIYEADATSKKYRYYVQSNSAKTALEIFLKAIYVDSYVNASVYHIGEVLSDETISARSGADDWSQYIEVTVNPAVASKVRIELCVNTYGSDNIYIDPKAVIS